MSHITAQNSVQTHIFTRKNHNPSPPAPQNTQQTHIFASKPQRFHYKQSQNPGPGTYVNCESTERSAAQINTQVYNREYLWITDKGRQLFETQSTWKYNLGPGKYLHTEHNHKHSNWPKNQRFEYHKTQVPSPLGPGLYDTNYPQKQLPAASSAFKSKTTKSYLADKITQLLKLQQPPNNPQNIFEPISQPSSLENERKYQRSGPKERGSPVFVSNCERLPTIQSEKVGPGSYEVQNSSRGSHSKRIVTEFHSKQPNRPKKSLTKHASHKIIIPGPGAYSNQLLSCPETQKKPLLCVMLKEQRFKVYSLHSKDYPGPADYQLCNKSTAKMQKKRFREANPLSNLKGTVLTNKLKGSMVRKHLTQQGEHIHTSHTNIYQLFRKIQKDKQGRQECSDEVLL